MLKFLTFKVMRNDLKIKFIRTVNSCNQINQLISCQNWLKNFKNQNSISFEEWINLTKLISKKVDIINEEQYLKIIV